MNCVFNRLLNKKTMYKNNYIPAYPDDLGVSIGATYLANFKFGKKTRKINHEKHNYFSQEFTDDQILSEIKKSKLKYSEIKKGLSKHVAKLISEGKLVGWFQGRMNFLIEL